MRTYTRIVIFTTAIVFALMSPDLIGTLSSADGYKTEADISISEVNPQQNIDGDNEVVISEHEEMTRSDAPTEIGTVTRTVELGPGERYYAYLDSENQVLVEMDITDDSENIPQEAKDAIQATPVWIRDDLEYTFTTLTASDAKTYADYILNPKDTRYVDEIAFSIAHSHSGLLRWMAQNGHDGLFSENAEAIYAIDDKGLNYAELVEKGDHTTLSYKSKLRLAINTKISLKKMSPAQSFDK